LEREFLRIHRDLKLDASARAAQAVFGLSNRGPANRRRLPAPQGSV
jgi:hypothetical protein